MKNCSSDGEMWYYIIKKFIGLLIFLPDNDKMELTCNKLKNERKQGGNCMKKGLKILTAFLLSVTMLAGCGKSKKSTEKGKTGEKTETNEKTGTAKDGGILRVGLSANVC